MKELLQWMEYLPIVTMIAVIQSIVFFRSVSMPPE